MKLSCPACRASFSLEVLLEDAESREFVGLVATLQPELVRELFQYLALFRSKSRHLQWSRALRLTSEVTAIASAGEVPTWAMAAALAETVQVFRAKQQQVGADAWKPLTNHNYLRRVLESTLARGEPAATSKALARIEPAAPASKMMQGLQALEGLKR